VYVILAHTMDCNTSEALLDAKVRGLLQALQRHSGDAWDGKPEEVIDIMPILQAAGTAPSADPLGDSRNSQVQSPPPTENRSRATLDALMGKYIGYLKELRKHDDPPHEGESPSTTESEATPGAEASLVDLLKCLDDLPPLRRR